MKLSKNVSCAFNTGYVCTDHINKTKIEVLINVIRMEFFSSIMLT